MLEVCGNTPEMHIRQDKEAAQLTPPQIDTQENCDDLIILAKALLPSEIRVMEIHGNLA